MRFSSAALICAGICLAGGMASAGYFVSQTIYNSKVALNTAEAKGLAERRVRADSATWSVGFGVAGRSRSELPALYQTAEAHQARILALFRDAGFAEAEITVEPLDYSYDTRRNRDQVVVEETHKLLGQIKLQTDRIEAIAPLRAEVSRLIAQGIDVWPQQPAFHFTRLNEIKPDMLREATRNARIAATEFAENAGVTVGGIRQARQGGFYIRDAGSEHSATDRVEKDVRVVTTITFYLTE